MQTLRGDAFMLPVSRGWHYLAAFFTGRPALVNAETNSFWIHLIIDGFRRNQSSDQGSRQWPLSDLEIPRNKLKSIM